MKKKIKQKKKSKEGGKNRDGDIVAHGDDNVGIEDGIDNNVDKSEKTIYTWVGLDEEKNGKTKCKLIDVIGEDVIENASNNAERKKKRRDKKGNTNQDSDALEFEIGGAVDVELNEGQKMPAEGSASKMSNHKEVECASNGKNKRKKVTRTGTNDPSTDGKNYKYGLTDDIENIGINDGIVNCVDEFEKKRSSKQNKENKKNAGVEVEVEKKGNTRSKLIVVNSKDVYENLTNNAEKKKKREKKKNTNQDSDTLEFEVGGGADVEVNERQKKPEEESVSKMSNHNKVESDNNGEKKRKKVKTKTGTNDPTPNKSNKKVKFSDEVEVFTIHNDSNTKGNWNDKEDNMVRGKRYTREEDEIIKEAVFKYIADYDLGEEGLRMVLDSQKHHELRGCWKQIATALPYRPVKSFYERTKRLLWRLENRKWTQEEYERLLNYQKEHGNKWRAIADELGKHPVLVSETWQRIKRQRRRGRWSQKEYQQLFDLVNADLQQKVNKEKRSMHGMLRDNISWTSISDELSTRPNAACCNKWYRQLTSPMVIQGVWADSDDYRMVGELYKLDANCIEDVNWDHLLEERSGDLCRKRWNQMILYIGNHQRKSFAEQVEVLAQRYCPHLLEAREAWDNKPRVP